MRKDWDRHVSHAEELSHTPGFRKLRDTILDLAQPAPGDRAMDIGTGTGLLALALARQVSCVWALDISASMVEYLRSRALSDGLGNVYPVVASATGIPLAPESVHLAVSNYCFHHLARPGKVRSLEEVFRVLAPGGRLVFGDMMFGWRPAQRRDRDVIASKVRAMARKGPAGFERLARNAVRMATLNGERPAPPEWWRQALTDAGFVDVTVKCLDHEGGIALARKPR